MYGHSCRIGQATLPDLVRFPNIEVGGRGLGLGLGLGLARVSVSGSGVAPFSVHYTGTHTVLGS